MWARFHVHGGSMLVYVCVLSNQEAGGCDDVLQTGGKILVQNFSLIGRPPLEIKHFPPFGFPATVAFYTC